MKLAITVTYVPDGNYFIAVKNEDTGKPHLPSLGPFKSAKEAEEQLAKWDIESIPELVLDAKTNTRATVYQVIPNP
jgi:hypothetical protein